MCNGHAHAHGHGHAHGHEHGHGHGHEHGHGHGHGHGEHDHHKNHLEIEGFSSISFESDLPFSLRKFQNFLDNQLPPGVYRAKGILWFNESERRHVFHLSGKRFSIDDTEWLGQKNNKLVLIGRELNHSQLISQLEACVGKCAGEGLL